MIQSIFIGNLPNDVTKEQVRTLFQPYGRTYSIYIPKDYETKKTRGYCYVEMDKEEAVVAIKKLDDKYYKGRKLRVNEAKGKNDDKFYNTDYIESSNITVTPGIHPNANLSHFSPIESQIIKKLSQEWYITYGGDEFTIANSVYRYCLIKPTNELQVLFNITREVLVIFSDYEIFDPRSLDAVSYALKYFPPNRVEKICCILFSKDKNIVDRISDILKLEQEFQIIVPFSYESFLANVDKYFVKNCIKKYFYSRDLFAFQSPLKRDIYFFGRQDLIHKIVNMHRSNENSGLFGLRKTGKTSVIFSIQRVLERENLYSTYIDCQNPGLHQRRWNSALHNVLTEIIKQNDLKISIHNESEFTPENASILFEEAILRISSKLKEKSILLIFDEIENLSFNISSSEHWATGFDFIFFWQSLRSVYQKNQGVFTYLIVGTNPMCVEKSTIFEKDNPIFNQLPYQYIEGFTIKDCQEMISKLGGIMGLLFDPLIYSKLVEDFGGHPFLIRQVCSIIHQISDPNRPVHIGTAKYEDAKKKFKEKFITYAEMILVVLERHYPDEFQLLLYLALGDIKTFKEFAALSPELINHLLGYGIVKKVDDDFEIRIESVKEYLVNKNKFKTINPTIDQIWSEIGLRRNNIEPKLRKIIRNQLIVTYNKSKAQEKIIKLFEERRREKYSGFSIDELLDPNKTEIFFEDLRKIIIKEWEIFKNIFNNHQEDFEIDMKVINRYRIDSHAKQICQDEFNQFRFSISRIENQINDFID